MPRPRSLSLPAPLIGFATAAYAGVVMIASLYPLAPWRWPDLERLASQLSEWPRYYSYWDVVLNVVAYVPLGLLLGLRLGPKRGPMRAATVAIFATTLFSAALEVAQSAIVSRVPSGLDVFCNAVGGWIGAWIALAVALGARVRRPGAPVRPEGRDPLADACEVLAALWLLAQFRADVWLFAMGDARSVVGHFEGEYAPRLNAVLEAVVAVAGSVALAGLVRCAARARAREWFLVFAGLGLLARSAGTAFLAEPGSAWQWATPGNLVGLAIGLGAGYAICGLAPRAAAAGAFAALLLGTAVVNLAPMNPYAANTPISVLYQNHIRNIAGTTLVVAMLWPLPALGCIAVRAFGGRRGRSHRIGGERAHPSPSRPP